MDFETELTVCIAGHTPAIIYSAQVDDQTARRNAISSLKTEILCASQSKLQGIRNQENPQYHSGLWAAGAKSMRNPRFGWVIFCALAATLGCRTPSLEWDGTWRVNPSKSNFQGPIFTISVSADGEYRYDDGRSSFTFRCDGKDRAIGKDRTRACVKSSATALDLTQKENGVKTRTNHWELSDHGKVLTSTATEFPPSGPVIASQVVASRVSGSDGFAGQWRDPSYLQRHADLTLRLDSQTLHISYPGAGQYVDAPLDGLDAAVHGPHAPDGLTYAARVVGRREISILTKRDGKIFTQGYLDLSDDGSVITETWWNPAQPADKSTFVYERK